MIIVADDDLAVQKTCKALLEEAGYTVMVTDTGYGVLAAMRAHQVSVVLTEIFLPEMDGLETLLKLKRERPEVPVVVMTDGGKRSRFDFLDTARKLGADAVLKKPIKAQELMGTIKACEACVSKNRKSAA